MVFGWVDPNGDFYPRPPRGGRHAKFVCSDCAWTDFYPRPPRGGRPVQSMILTLSTQFLSTPSARRATVHRQRHGRRDDISIHALREEGDLRRLRQGDHSQMISIHALREEGDSSRNSPRCFRAYFYPRPPRGGRPAGLGFQQLLRDISIHALREEGDPRRFDPAAGCADFYPRPPRGGRRTSWRAACVHKHFYPRPPRGGRRSSRAMRPPPSKFLSTPSARRATRAKTKGDHHDTISIHALREEGDSDRPPERRASMISIHALREEGDTIRPHRHDGGAISIHALREEGDSKNRDKISIFKQIIQHSARI